MKLSDVLEDTAGIVVVIIALAAGSVIYLLAKGTKAAAKTPTTQPSAQPAPAPQPSSTTTPKSSVATQPSSAPVLASATTTTETVNLLQQALTTQKPVISSTSLEGMGGQSALSPPSDLVNLGPVYASPSTDKFYSRGIVGYNADGSPVYAYAQLGGWEVPQSGGTVETSYSQYLKDVASGALTQAAAEARQIHAEQRLGLL